MSINVFVYFGEPQPTESVFDVPPRAGEQVLWHDASIGGDAFFRVDQTWHAPAGEQDFMYFIRLVPIHAAIAVAPS